MTIDHATEELSLISSGISSLNDLSIRGDLISLNLHGNCIKRIQNLNHLSALKHLDLSSNLIEVFPLLENLVSLRTLNISNNGITDIRGLSNLTCLRVLDISYNLVTECSALRHLTKLEKLFAQGNRISSLPDLCLELSHCLSLRTLVVAEGNKSNDFCQSADYRKILFTRIPSLDIVDYRDKFGNKCSDIENLNDIPGLDEYLEYLTDELSSDINIAPLITEMTPKIDEAISAYKLKASLPSYSEEIPAEDRNQSEARIKALEEQLAKLNSQTQTFEKKDKTKGAKQDSTGTSSSVLSELQKPSVKTSRKTIKPVNKPITKSENQTLASIMKEVEVEREKRWKAEESITTLKNAINELEHKQQQQKIINDANSDAYEKLKSSASLEREHSSKLERDLGKLAETLKERESRIEVLQNEKHTQRQEIENLRSKIRKFDNDHTVLKANESKREEILTNKLKSLAYEYEQLQSKNNDLKNAYRKLQHEAEAGKEKSKSLYSLDSPEIQKIVDDRMSAEREYFKSKLSEADSRYKELEDEFRMALYSEERRFVSLEEDYRRTCEKLTEASEKVEHFHAKSEKSSKLVQELTNVIKEQKGRISELYKVKQELQNEMKAKGRNLETQVESLREKLSDHDALKKDKTKLAAHIQAQDSIIEGLRKERKLWEEELAKQGMSLAADRGRLELRIEGLERELAELRKTSDAEKDSLKIKAKVIEDQTDTIKKLKDAIIERDQTIVKTREEVVKGRKDVEEQLEEETKLRQELQEEVNLLTDRKEGLKEDLASLHSQLEDEKQAHTELAAKWKQKSALISQLEKQVKEMKASWDAKECELKKERDKAINAAQTALTRLQSSERRLEEETSTLKARLESEKSEIQSTAERRIAEVEDEMRIMLRQHEKYKKNMEAKFNKLHSALSDLNTIEGD